MGENNSKKTKEKEMKTDLTLVLKEQHLLLENLINIIDDYLNPFTKTEEKAKWQETPIIIKTGNPSTSPHNPKISINKTDDQKFVR